MSRTKKDIVEKDVERGASVGLFKPIVESPEETERKKQEKIKLVLKSYHKSMTQADALSALDELSDVVTYDEGLCDMGKKFLKVLMEKQDITEFQALIFSALFCVCPKTGLINAYEIGQLFGKSGMFILQHLSEIDELCDSEKKLLYRAKGRNDIISSYGIRKDVFEAVLRNEKYVQVSLKKNSVESFLFEFGRITNNYEEENDWKDYKFNYIRLLEDNQHLPFVKKLNAAFGDEDSVEFRMFMFICLNTIRGRYDTSVRELTVVEKDTERLDLEIMLSKGDTYIQIKKLVEYACDNGLVDRSEIKLTAKSLKKFLPGVKTPQQNDSTQTSIIKHEKITKKDLFFPDDFKKNVDDLYNLLSEERFKEIQSRLKKRGQRTGLCGLLYGAPGAGKTESVLQIAKATGRDVLQVNISEIKSMWVGQSEKNIQAVFDHYKELCKGSGRTPILLFNESDAILNKRLSNVRSSVDQMSNSMQNIILQSMEEMEGIMLCTTNLVDQNLDPAFERRFLYKLKFPETTAEVRAKIWKSMLPELNEDDALVLAKKFNFSGGQIENVVRRWNIDEILYGTPDNMLDKLTELCESEKLEKMNNRKIGFAAQ